MCALSTEGAAECRGWNDFGQLDSPNDKFTKLALSSGNTCGLLDDGTAKCWGFDFDSLLVSPEGTFKEVSANAALHSCAVRTDDSLVCWGADVEGWLDAPNGSFSDLEVDGTYSCAKRIGGRYECWGVDAEYRTTPDRPCIDLPDGGRVCRGEYAWPVPDSLKGRFSDIAGSVIGTCAWGHSQHVECWDPVPDWGPELELGEPANWGPSGRFVSVTSSSYVFCGVKIDAEADCWGWIGEDPLDIPEGPFLSVSTGEWHACGLREDGTLACWWTRFKPRPDYVTWQ